MEFASSVLYHEDGGMWVQYKQGAIVVRVGGNARAAEEADELVEAIS